MGGDTGAFPDPSWDGGEGWEEVEQDGTSKPHSQ